MYHQINYYDAEVMYIDDTVKEIYNYFAGNGLNEDALWIITGDHGEGLGNHNWFTHAKKINAEALRIPLIFHMNHPKGRGQGKRGVTVNTPVEHSDILSTLTDLFGISLKSYAPGSPGASLKRFIIGKGKPYEKKYSFSQREYFKYRARWSKKTRPDYLVYEPGDTYSLQSKEFQYILRTKGEDEFYNLHVDPYGTVNLIQTADKKQRRSMFLFLSEIRKYIKKYERINPVEMKKASQKEIEKTKTLGYVE